MTGVEVRESLIDRAQEAFSFYGQDPETYRFVCGDVFEVLAREKFDVDVVLCFGYLYHTFRHTELMYRLHNVAPKHLIVDTMVSPETQPTLKVIREEDAEDIRSAAQDAYPLGRVSVLRPSVPALQICCAPTVSRSNPCTTGRAGGRPPARAWFEGYASGKRVTLRCRSREAAIAAGWEPVAPLPIAAGPPPARDANGPRHRPPRSRPVGGARGSTQTLAKATGYELQRASTKR